MVEFLDLNTPGKSFLIIIENVTEKDYLLTHMRKPSTVGNIMAIIKPEAPTKALNNMLVVNIIMPLVPLAMLNSIPFVPLVTPQSALQ
jgi:hypothetical protein